MSWHHHYVKVSVACIAENDLGGIASFDELNHLATSQFLSDQLVHLVPGSSGQHLVGTIGRGDFDYMEPSNLGIELERHRANGSCGSFAALREVGWK